MAKDKTESAGGEVKPLPVVSEVATETPPEVTAEPLPVDLTPLTIADRQTLTWLANRYGMENAESSASVVEKFVRDPKTLESYAFEINAIILRLAKLLEPFPDAATLKEINDKPVA